MIEYVLSERIGGGGMGEVYKATETTPGGARMPVACKLLKSALREERPIVAMFQEEAAINRRISHKHPGLVALHHWVKPDPNGQDYMIMELIEGCSLRELLDHASHGVPMTERLSFDMVRLIARDFLDALAFVHRHGHIHRDISPGNVMISEEGAIKLIDLGLARDADGKPGNQFDGKPPFASPETLPGGTYDERSDLYSFGAMLYCMLTGKPPFGEQVTFKDLAKRMFPDGWQVPRLPDDIPEDLRALSMGLLQPESDKRNPTNAAAARATLAAPESIDTTRARLAQVAAELHQLAHQRRTAEEPGSCVGVHLMALHMSDRKSLESQSRPSLPKRAISHRQVVRMLGLGLIAAAAIRGLALGLYRHGAGPAAPNSATPMTIAAHAEEPAKHAANAKEPAAHTEEPAETAECPLAPEECKRSQPGEPPAEQPTGEPPAPTSKPHESRRARGQRIARDSRPRPRATPSREARPTTGDRKRTLNQLTRRRARANSQTPNEATNQGNCAHPGKLAGLHARRAC